MATYLKYLSNFRSCMAILRFKRSLKIESHQCTLFSKQFPRQKLWAPTFFGGTWAFLGLFSVDKNMSEDSQVRKVVSRGIVARQNGKIDEASQAFHEALTKSTDFKNEKKITDNMHLNHRVFIYDQIADMMLDIGDYKNAELVFKDTMKLALQLGMAEDDNAMIEMSLKLASIYLYTGRMDIGVIGIRHVIAEQEKKLGAKKEEKETDKNIAKDTKAALEEEQNTKVLLGKAYRHYGNYHMQSRKFKEGREMMAKALKVSADVLGENDDNTFVIMNDLATCEILLENYKDAENLLKKGVANSGKAKSSIQSALLSNLGALYIRTGRYEEAERACQRGLTVAEKANDKMLMMPCKACLIKLQSLKKKVEDDDDD